MPAVSDPIGERVVPLATLRARVPSGLFVLSTRIALMRYEPTGQVEFGLCR